MDAATRRLVRERAGNRCEYCHLRQDAVSIAAFHVEHVVPKQHQGGDDPSNLALACYHCNRHKGPNLAGLDPASGQLTALYNPRTQVWEEHFEDRDGWILGRTPTGRTTVEVLAMNEDELRRLRGESAQ